VSTTAKSISGKRPAVFDKKAKRSLSLDEQFGEGGSSSCLKALLWKTAEARDDAGRWPLPLSLRVC
jgi:hypothetical protein